MIEHRDRPATSHGAGPSTSPGAQSSWDREDQSSPDRFSDAHSRLSPVYPRITSDVILADLETTRQANTTFPYGQRASNNIEAADSSPKMQHGAPLRPQPDLSHNLASSRPSSATLSSDRPLPSEIISSHVPPERQLPAGFPTRPISSSSERLGAWQDKSNTTCPSSRPNTRSRAGTKASKNDSRPTSSTFAADTVLTEPSSRPSLHLKTTPRLEPPLVSSAYNFQRPSTSLKTSPTSTTSILFSSPGLRPTIPPSSPPTSPGRHIPILQQHGAFLSEPHNVLGRDVADQLAAYAAGTVEERATVLDHFICENLRNEDFLKLCEDVDACWRRIGLGL
ncbi:hypothetical protein K461DRAFT_135885 [Myriangium duriaei CBS 260.36]|uniref:Uncharacterized protein n=1 Tax=Myriangium duriaei CBS 260.36 TaxID=1168546 RepID=A0A9P4MG41_9PEZI|nr:hypothetical protein K461DRAFT_135885 [Myriangium duriaei CBS 260.36]